MPFMRGVLESLRGCRCMAGVDPPACGERRHYAGPCDTGNAVRTILWYCWQKHLRRSGRPQSAMVVREACPACGSERCKRNGPLHTGQQNHHGQACGRPLVLHADNRVIGEAQRIVMERLHGENTALPGLCQAVGITIRWLM